MQEQLSLLNKITDELNSDLDPDNMLQRVLDLTVSHLEAAKGSILLFNENRQVAKQILMRRNLTEADRNWVVGRVLSEGFAGWVVDHERGDIIADIHEDQRWVRLPDQPYDYRSAIACPLRRRERVLGVLTLVHPDPNFFRSEHLSLLTAIAGQAAIALENAHLYEQSEGERARLWAILNGTQDAVIATDSSDRLLLLNPAAKILFEISNEDWLGKSLATVINNQTLVDLWTPLPPMAGEIPLSDGRTLWANVTEVTDLGRVAVLRDISQYKDLDEAKSELITTFTHDLGAPLAIVKGYVELVKMDGPINRQQEHDLEGIIEAADQMKAIIKGLLELGRIETIEDLGIEPLTLNDLVETTATSFRSLAEVKNIKLVFEPNAQTLTVEGNPALLARALDNLVENAIKYTPPGGRVTVTLTSDSKEAIVSIIDTGVGIPEQDLPRVFEKFYRADMHKDDKGTGLGLAIVKSIIERHAGRVWVESRVKRGSTFTVTLPLINVPAKQKPKTGKKRASKN